MSDIDWSLAPEWATKYGTAGYDAMTVFYNEDQYSYIGGGQKGQIFNCMNGRDIHSLTLIEERTSKPIFTQEMKDNGDLPLVGMEIVLVYNYDSKTVKHTGSVLFASKDNCVLSMEHGERHFLIGDYVYEATAPPIELIDKQHYLFSVNNRVQAVGQAYLSASDEWMINNLRTNSSFEASRCTNIQLLEVKS